MRFMDYLAQGGRALGVCKINFGAGNCRFVESIVLALRA